MVVVGSRMEREEVDGSCSWVAMAIDWREPMMCVEGCVGVNSCSSSTDAEKKLFF